MDDLSNDSKEVVDYADFKSIYTYKYHTQDMHDVSKIRIQSRENAHMEKEKDWHRLGQLVVDLSTLNKIIGGHKGFHNS